MIVGIDEVGRGCWAGPLVVAGVALEHEIEGLADSKDLSEKRRIQLEPEIIQKSAFHAVAWVSSTKIDKVGLSKAMYIACEHIFSEFSKLKGAKFIIDGNVNYLKSHNHTESMVKADSKIQEVMAASILAKQARDGFMKKLAEKFPEFGWDSNVGYGTKAHSQAIADHGVTQYHRLSYKPVAKYASETGQYRRGGGSK